MDDKYKIGKPKKPETKSEVLAAQIEELVKQRDLSTDPKTKQALNTEITKLFAQWQRSNI